MQYVIVFMCLDNVNQTLGILFDLAIAEKHLLKKVYFSEPNSLG